MLRKCQCKQKFYSWLNFLNTRWVCFFFFFECFQRNIFLHWYFEDLSVLILRDKANGDLIVNLSDISVKEKFLLVFLGFFFHFFCFLCNFLLLFLSACLRLAFKAGEDFESLQTIHIGQGCTVKSRFPLNIADVC